MIQSGMEVNMTTAGAIDRDDSILDFCRLNDITIQTWSPFQYGFFEGVFIGSDKYPELTTVWRKLQTNTTQLRQQLQLHGSASPCTHAAVAGTTKPSRFREICAAAILR